MKLKATLGLCATTFLLGAASGLATEPHIFKATARVTPVVVRAATSEPAATHPIPFTTAPNYRAIVARNAPAVVGITTEEDVPIPQVPFGGLWSNDPFFQFFRAVPIPRGNVRQRALGSGFIISPDGLILTNAHVVRDAKRVSVKLADRREFKAKVLGYDTITDIAVLKIDAQQLPTTRFGNSDRIDVGDYVLAIGQPYGFEESATAGIVSAKGRALPGDSAVAFIQTDVAVNPGNSGGPLFDSDGDVIGINSQIYTTTGAYQGVSFAIPINLALHIKDEIVAHGTVEHARLGVQIQPLTPGLASSFKLTNAAGALVSSVDKDTAAARAGVKPGDVILKYDDEPVSDPGDLSSKVAVAEPGQQATLDIWRDGRSITLAVTLGAAKPFATTAAAGRSGGSAEARRNQIGLTVRPLTPEERDEAGVSEGLVVEGVAGRAADAGIELGDVVLAVNGAPVKSARQMHDIIDKQQREVALLIERNHTRIFVPIELG